MPKKIESLTREQIARLLPEAIAKAMDSYQLFLSREDTSDAKSFKAHHDACKGAIAHVELLIKLARWADMPDSEIMDQGHKQVLMAMIADARDEASQHDDTDPA